MLWLNEIVFELKNKITNGNLEIYEGKQHEDDTEETKGVIYFNFEDKLFNGKFGIGNGQFKEIIGNVKIIEEETSLCIIELEPLWTNNTNKEYCKADNMGVIRTTIKSGGFTLMGAEFIHVRSVDKSDNVEKGNNETEIKI